MVGHGHSDGDRAHVEKFEHFVTDYIQFVRLIQTELESDYKSNARGPVPPAFLLGYVLHT